MPRPSPPAARPASPAECADAPASRRGRCSWTCWMRPRLPGRMTAVGRAAGERARRLTTPPQPAEHGQRDGHAHTRPGRATARAAHRPHRAGRPCRRATLKTGRPAGLGTWRHAARRAHGQAAHAGHWRVAGLRPCRGATLHADRWATLHTGWAEDVAARRAQRQTSTLQTGRLPARRPRCKLAGWPARRPHRQTVADIAARRPPSQTAHAAWLACGRVAGPPSQPARAPRPGRKPVPQQRPARCSIG